ncbi:hypothetical protein [Nonomuraea sp. NPDC050310]|uniref:hypothetical protein n=1 Tax=Nonomuraea sp. NPDC050310 TaxID=3154935 RepID=UPI0033FBA066
MVISGRAVLAMILAACLLMCLPGPHSVTAAQAAPVTHSDHQHDQCDAPVVPPAPGSSAAELTLDGLVRGWLPVPPEAPVAGPAAGAPPAVPAVADPLLLLCTSRR